MHKDITFNTGRLYVAGGQIVRARFDAHKGLIYFHDFSRMIAGTIEPGKVNVDSEAAFARSVMQQYDLGNYGGVGLFDSAVPQAPGDAVLAMRI